VPLRQGASGAAITRVRAAGRGAALGLLTAGALASAVGLGGCAPAEKSRAFEQDECIGISTAALRTCPKATTLPGIDVSTFQGNVNWPQVKASGRVFSIARVSAGLKIVDSKFAQNWPGMKSAGMVRGVYQFFHPNEDAVKQADLLIAKVDAAGGLQPGDLPPVLDLEDTDDLASSVVVSQAKLWLARVEARYGVKPFVYTAFFMSDVIGSHFSGYPLWVANYNATCPLMPAGWTEWVFWQTSDTGVIPGISGATDTNLFNGTLAQLQAVTIPPPKASRPPAPLPASLDVDLGGSLPDDTEGSVMGSGRPSTAQTESATLPSCR